MERELIASQERHRSTEAMAGDGKGIASIRDELRSAGLWSMGFGVLNLLFPSSSNGFGVLMLIVGLASLYVQTAPMFIVIGVTFAWAAVSNLLLIPLGNYSGIIWAIVQIPVAFEIVRKFARHRPTSMTSQFELNEGLSQPEDRAAVLFPVSGCLVGAVSLPGLLFSFLLIGLLAGPDPSVETPGILLFATDFFVNLGILGIGLGVAALASGHRLKPLSLVAILAGSLPALIRFFVMFAYL